MPRTARRAPDDTGVQLRLDLETPEQVFQRVFRELKLRANGPEFDLRFRPYANLRSTVRFDTRSGRMKVDLSDQLIEAPPEVLDAHARILLCKLYKKRVPVSAIETYRRWTASPEIQRRMHANRRKRGRKHMLPPAGKVHDLDALFDRLNERHFAADLRKPALGWSQHSSRRRLGHYDPAHDAIVISQIFDRPEVPALALEYVLFHEMLHLKHPIRLGETRRCVHTPEFLAEERRFPGYETARSMLESL